MKCILLGLAIFAVGALAAPVANNPATVILEGRSITHGRPACRTPEELAARLYRHNWDPSKWWECTEMNRAAELKSCPEGKLYFEAAKTCIPKNNWVWSDPKDPPSLAEWNGLPPQSGICPADNPSCPCPTPCPPCPEVTTTTPCPPCPTTTTTTPCPPCPTTTTTTPCPPCPTTTTTPCPPCPTTTTTTPCPPCPTTTTTTPCPPCPEITTTTPCPPCPQEMICEAHHMGLQWPGSQPNTFIVCHTINMPGIEMACPAGQIFFFEQQNCA